ncbi:hypothetical protein SCHPADRAFT_763545 [Schizopora paradoxa]|uniref:Uncharacterized protein n=1 Tax=Schizopora paradoxa TaxID=27342 RepID=A0A0H2QWV8_9AGAM|nr:hypothetical protein SCHPADRAFT_763545 [Schizopora paradoxa]
MIECMATPANKQGRAATRSPAFDTSRRRLFSAGPRSIIDGEVGAAWTLRTDVEGVPSLRASENEPWPCVTTRQSTGLVESFRSVPSMQRLRCESGAVRSEVVRRRGLLSRAVDMYRRCSIRSGVSA